MSNEDNYAVREIILETRKDAENVLGALAYMTSLGFVTVSDLYDLVSINPVYMDEKYGWTDFKDAKITEVEAVSIRVGGEQSRAKFYRLELPPAKLREENVPDGRIGIADGAYFGTYKVVDNKIIVTIDEGRKRNLEATIRYAESIGSRITLYPTQRYEDPS